MNVQTQRSEVPAVESAVRILEYLSRYKHRSSSLSDISKSLSINKSTCHRILKVLAHYHIVVCDEETKHYSLGSYLIALGTRASEFTDYLEISKPVLKWLCSETQQTCVLLEPISNNKLMYVAKEEANLPVRVTVNIGQQFPLTGASFGKCFLAFMEDSKAEQLIKHNGFKQFTSKSITNISQFKQEIQRIRLQGYAQSYEEHTPGVYGIAAPIFDAHCSVNMVIGCVGLSHLLGSRSIDDYGSQVVEASRKITKLLGGRIPLTL